MWQVVSDNAKPSGDEDLSSGLADASSLAGDAALAMDLWVASLFACYAVQR
jgi:hypothetical protein